ncbi:hypothetical protein [Myxococcus xanthus]|uniref:Uncharacterized protein n=1 Tax=Myxococcus xanthus TaxID=34 RepID=A0A7Y4ILF0_MYXXA|nr:hypothetical protein [Myxococcus xanthus]NOJ81443.1 hypothetical protein [Myxococcus xanthus]NOJ88192.1 hypothetical protein [Myxococcus xanthus]
MPLSAAALPYATPHDPSEDAPSSVDPLGTQTDSERLADVLLPGFTARMWKLRFVTFSAVASFVADRVVAALGREEFRLDARLGFERLYVSSLVRAHEENPSAFGRAPDQLPGRRLARAALLAEEPLTKGNFLQGQAINGPFGVMARLTRHLGVVDDESRPGRSATNLVLDWAVDEGLPGILDNEGSREGAGAQWKSEVCRAVSAHVSRSDWPRRGHRIWELLARPLRPDVLGKREKANLSLLIQADSLRQRMMALLTDGQQAYATASNRDGKRGPVERHVLLHAVAPALGSEPVDRLLRATIDMSSAYEDLTGLLQQAFDAIRWTLVLMGGRATPQAVLGHPVTKAQLARTVVELRRVIPEFTAARKTLSQQPSIRPELLDALDRLQTDATGCGAPDTLAETVMSRHHRVQKAKRKADWVDRDSHWTLMPGFGISGEAPPSYQGSWMHPFRVMNAYSALSDLGKVSAFQEVSDGEA